MDNSEKAHLRFQERSCANCRYYREHETSAVVSECLLLGRTLGINSADQRQMLYDWARARLCDFWSRRPAKWIIYSKGIESNPHFADQYLSRDGNRRRQKRLGLQVATDSEERARKGPVET